MPLPSCSEVLNNKGLQEEILTKVGLDVIDTFTTLASNKSHMSKPGKSGPSLVGEALGFLLSSRFPRVAACAQ